MRRLELAKLWTPFAAVAMILAALAIAFLLVPIYVVKLLSDTSAPVSAPPAAAWPSYQAADQQVPSVPAQAEQPPARQLSASEPGLPSHPEDSSPGATEQRSFKSRRALETVDPRELLRQGAIPK